MLRKIILERLALYKGKLAKKRKIKKIRERKKTREKRKENIMIHKPSYLKEKRTGLILGDQLPQVEEQRGCAAKEGGESEQGSCKTLDDLFYNC